MRVFAESGPYNGWLSSPVRPRGERAQLPKIGTTLSMGCLPCRTASLRIRGGLRQPRIVCLLLWCWLLSFTNSLARFLIAVRSASPKYTSWRVASSHSTTLCPRSACLKDTSACGTIGKLESRLRCSGYQVSCGTLKRLRQRHLVPYSLQVPRGL